MGSISLPEARPDRLTFPEFSYALPANAGKRSKRPRQAGRERVHEASEQHAASQLHDEAVWQHGLGAGAEQLSAFDPAPSHAQPAKPELDGAGPDDYGFDAGLCLRRLPACCIIVLRLVWF